MYRLLIVTTNQATKDMLASMEGWEALGVKPPRVRETVEDAVKELWDHCDEILNYDRIDEILTEVLRERGIEVDEKQ